MYLIASDFNKSIQGDALNQIIGNDDSVLTSAELTAIEEARSYLVQKYLLDQEFSDTLPWDNSKTYQSGTRVFINAQKLDPSFVYSANAYVCHNSNIYQSINGGSGVFQSSDWKLICSQFQIFYAAPPVPVFNVYGPYRKGDQVFYNGKTFTCQSASVFPSRPPSLEYTFYENVPLANGFPGSSSQWDNGVPYNIPADVDIQDSRWFKGDNRSQQLVTYVVDITLYHLHSRIAPRNIPELRIDRYHNAINWFKMVSRGEITAGLPPIQPRSGGRIRYGGPIKIVNTYSPFS